MENASAVIASIATIRAIPAIIWKSKHSDRNDSVSFFPNAPSDYMEISRHDRSDRMFSAIVTIVSDHMETESGLYLGEGSEKFRYVFTFRFRNYFLGANVSPPIISLDSLVGTEIFAEINFKKQGK